MKYGSARLALQKNWPPRVSERVDAEYCFHANSFCATGRINKIDLTTGESVCYRLVPTET
jgi:hypothetical protein